MKDAVAHTVGEFGEINILCCNAGVCRLAPFEKMSDEVR
jgi:NAD(P)-dependent dehydrogenase (short-subunit alcohol dehydrogenase family)